MMEEMRIIEVGAENEQEVCVFYLPPEKRREAAVIRGMEEKREWNRERLQRWGKFAKLAYIGPSAVGQIQYEPVPDERIVFIYCLYVPYREHWRKGVGKKLLSSLMEEMRRPQVWFEHQPASALVTRAFPGGQQGQYSARLFFTDMGFKQVGDDPDFLYYPLKEGFVYQPLPVKAPEYILQEEDRGKAVIIYGPSFCYTSYPFLKKAEGLIKEAAPEIPIRWIHRTEELEEVKKRGDFEGIIVNANPIRSFVLDTENFQREVREALKR